MKTIQWGKMPDGRNVTLYALSNGAGIEAAITNYGATVVSLKVPDRDSNLDEIILGYDDLGGYLAGIEYFGATIGRYANRIAHGQFTLDGRTYSLSRNERDNTLHSGLAGFNKKLWNARVPPGHAESVEFEYLSKDGEGGFPGNLSVRVLYTLTQTNELRIDYYATTDQKTILNLTNHCYFNLAGAGSGPILDHRLFIDADNFLPCDEFMIPTGEICPVQSTPFDFRSMKTIRAGVFSGNDQVRRAGGYDHTWVLKGSAHEQIKLAAKVHEVCTGRVLEVFTTEPGIQYYAGNQLKGLPGRAGQRYSPHDALCLETQHFPDSPHHSQFPSTVVTPSTPFVSTSIYRFCSDS